MAKNKSTEVTYPQAIRDVIIAGMDKGQLLPVLLFLFFIGILFRLPSEDLSELMRDFFQKLADGQILGYILFIGGLALWFFHHRFICKVHDKEVERISQEKANLQANINGESFPSSNGDQLA